MFTFSNDATEYYDDITLTLEGKDSNKYNCTLSKSQIKESSFSTDVMIEFDQDTGKIVFDPRADLNSGN